MAYNSTKEYLNIVDRLTHDYNIPKNITDPLLGYLKSIYRSELEDRFSAPMLWIGMYIALASLVCILAMVADLVHGFRSRKLWFPSKYFRTNSAFLTVIAVATKLPVDLTGLMPGYVDQVAKLGSMAFMCTMMANLLPCLGTMESNELLSNTISLCVLVVTLVVNVCIQMQTGVVSISTHKEDPRIIQLTSPTHITANPNPNPNSVLPFIYVILLVVLLIIHICSSLAILKSIQIIEDKYQEGHDTASKHIQPSRGTIVTVEMLEKHVGNHWIMAESGSSLHFITACFHTTSASGVICLLVTILHTYTMFGTIQAMLAKEYDSDYGWSMVVILTVQSIGVVIGTIVPLFRCFSTLRFKVFFSIHFKVFKVELYWTEKLYDWKWACIRLPFHSRKLERVIETFRRLILNIWIQLQEGVVVLCKIIALIPLVFVICLFYCIQCLKWLFMKVESSFTETIEYVEIRPYVLYLDNGMWVGERALGCFFKSMRRLLQLGENNKPRHLIDLLEAKTTSNFEGVAKFDKSPHYSVQTLLSEEQYFGVSSSDCWRLHVLNLTTIAVSLPFVEKDEVDRLLDGVWQGLEYVRLVEESLNGTYDHVRIQKAADNLWKEFRFHNKWLGHELPFPTFQVPATQQVVEWYRDKASNLMELYENTDNDSILRLICADSMYGITTTILGYYDGNFDGLHGLFETLSSMIADIIAACLTNLPQIITMKCHTSVREERQTRLKEAAQLLGETRDIINFLQEHDIPGIYPSDMPFLSKWRAYFREFHSP